MPILRQMTNDDLLAYQQLCTICYNYTDTDAPEPLDEKTLHIRRGVFAEDGRLLSAMMQIPYSVRFNGQDVKLVGIGGVVTDPVARRGGAIRYLFEEGLPRLYQEGHVFSALFPFSFRFYGKFGYTWAHFGRRAAICPRDIRADLKAADEIVRVLPGEEDQGMAAIYEQYIADKDLAFHRDEWMWKELRRGTPWADMKHAYVLRAEGKPVAYWIGKVHKGDEASLHIADMAWNCPRGRDAIFAMLRGMNELGSVEMRCQGGFDLRSVVEEAYDVSEKGPWTGMVRVVNVARALALLDAPVLPGRVTIRVTDGQIPENNGCFTVAGDGYALAVTTDEREEPDLVCDIAGLSALLLGRHTLRDAVENGAVQMLRDKQTRFAGLLFGERKLHVNHGF